MQDVILKVLWYLVIEGFGERECPYWDGAEENSFCFRLDVQRSLNPQPNCVDLKVGLTNMELSLSAYRDDSHEEYGKKPGDWEGDWYWVEEYTLLYKVTNTGLAEVWLARMLYVYLKHFGIELPKKLADPLRSLALSRYHW